MHVLSQMLYTFVFDQNFAPAQSVCKHAACMLLSVPWLKLPRQKPNTRAKTALHCGYHCKFKQPPAWSRRTTFLLAVCIAVSQFTCKPSRACADVCCAEHHRFQCGSAVPVCWVLQPHRNHPLLRTADHSHIHRSRLCCAHQQRYQALVRFK